MRFYKENSEIKNGADTKTVDISFQGKITVGRFVDIEAPTYIDSMNERFREVFEDKYQTYEGARWA